MRRTLIARSLLVLVMLATSSTTGRATMPALDGALAPEVVQAVSQGLLDVPDHGGLSTSSVMTQWFLPVIMVEFSDSTLRYGPADLQPVLFDTTGAMATGSVVDYWNWVTGSRIRIRGEVVARVTLPRPEEYYANFSYGLNGFSTPRNDWGLVRDAVVATDPLVDWNRFDRNGDGFVDMIWIVHAGIPAEGSPSRTSLWSVTSAMSGPWSNGGAHETEDLIPGSTNHNVHVDRFTILPELSLVRPGALSEIGVYCHEFGHALGLPDLYDTSSLGGGSNMGPGNWSLMSSGSYGGDGHSPEYPTHPGAWCLLYLNMVDKITPSQDTVVTIPPLSSGGPVYELFYQGASNREHFLLEQRRREGFDRNLPGDGLLITQVDDLVIGIWLAYNRINAGPTPGLRVLEADGDFDMTRGGNRGDPNDIVPGATNTTYLSDDTSPPLRLFDGSISNLIIDGIQRQGGSTRARLRVSPAGWFAIEDVTEPSFAPTVGFSRGRHSAMNSLGDEIETFSDERSGAAQVMLRTRGFVANGWTPAQVVSQSSVGAYDPTLTLLPHGDVGLAWSDLREGLMQIYYRERIRGVWGPESRVSTRGGGAPAIASDASGQVHLAWVEPGSPRPTIQFVSFPSGFPGGESVTLSDTSSVPSAPSLATTPGGDAWVLWPDLRSGAYAIYFARFSPDSGALPPMRLTPGVLNSQPSVDVIADNEGSVHVAWQQFAQGASEIHYQKRPAIGAPFPPELTIVTSTQPLQNPTLGVDRSMGVHVAFERSTPLGQVIGYTHWRRTHGWDVAPCDASDPAHGSAGRASVLAISPGNVNVLYSDAFGGTSHMRERRRRLDPIPVAVDVEARTAPALHVGPSPLRAGREFVAEGRELEGLSSVDLVDIAGRRVASARPVAGRARFGPAQTRDLAPGLYFLHAPSGSVGRLVVLR